MELKCSSCQKGQLEMCAFWQKWVYEKGCDPSEVVEQCQDYEAIREDAA